MNCEELFKVLGDYLDDEAKREVCEELREHIRECSYCRAHVHTMQGTVSLARELAAPPIHQEWVARLRMRITQGRNPAAG
jgi:predicted anti-sigma-YlaC factor YlaD